MKRIDDIRVAHKSWAVAGFSLAALVAYAGVSMTTVDEVRIGSDRYAGIAQNNVLLADVLPPPAYLVESHLTAHRMLSLVKQGDTAGFATAQETLDRLSQEYEGRQEYWTEHLTDEAARDSLLVDAYVPGAEYLAMARDEFVPLLEDGEIEQAGELLDGAMEEAYAAHRAGIDDVVEQTAAAAASQEAAAIGTADDRSQFLLVLLLVALAIVVPLSVVVVRSIVRPVTALRRRMAEIGEGTADLSRRLPVDRADEFGRVAESFNAFASKLEEMLETVADRARSLIADSSELAQVSEHLDQASRRTLDHTGEVAGASELVSSAIGIVVHASHEMQAAIDEIARSATSATSTADEAVRAAASADSIIGRLDHSSAKISEVTNLISTIAEQTNLLALNATIESARAGDAGKGFAVVANEVKDLSRATADATGDITQRIDEIRRDVEAAVLALGEVRTIISTMSDAQGLIAAAVEEQTATTSEITRVVTDAAGSADTIASAVVGSSAAAAETSSGATATRAAADRVATAARELQTVVGSFTR